jgi:hypothetical protein
MGKKRDINFSLGRVVTLLVLVPLVECSAKCEVVYGER